jgi:hypothetical protein
MSVWPALAATGTSFAAGIGEWSAFFTLAGGAAATLTGLLFVALSINPDVLKEDLPLHQRPATLASQSFSDLLLTLAIALLMLVPRQSARTLAFGLAAIGAIGLLQALRRLLGLAREHARGRMLARAALRYAVPTAGHIWLLFTAYTISRSSSADAVGNLVGIVLVLALSAAGNAWRLLLALGAGKTDSRR